MEMFQQVTSWFSKQKIGGKVAIGCVSLFMLCCLCSIPVAILSPSKPAEPETQAPQATQTPTATLVPEFLHANIVQNRNEKEWTSTQYTKYLETIKGKQVTGWSGKILDINDWAGETYLSLDMKAGEPLIDAYVYISEEDILKVGLGQNVTFDGTIDGDWNEPNDFYSLQIKNVKLIKFGEIPTRTPIPTLALTPTLEFTPTSEVTTTLESTPSQEILTIANNEDMAKLFKGSDFDPFTSEFAKKYAGRIIQFDGYVAYITPLDDYKTRFGILIHTGNFGSSSGNALNFKFEDFSFTSDLKLTGSNILEAINYGQNLRITAKVEEYDEVSGLFFLKPVSTEIRLPLQPNPTENVSDTYKTLFVEKVPAFIKAFTVSTILIQQVANDSSLMFDNIWKTKMGISLNILNIQADEMAKLEPSPKYVKLQSILVKLANETHLFTDDYVKGIDNIDSVLIGKATQHLSNINTLIQEAISEMEKLNTTP